MKKIKVALYSHSKSLFWILINWKQGKKYASRYARYSHTELLFEDWRSFSSSEEDWGVRFKNIKFKNYHWDFVEISVSNEKYENILKFCEKQKWNSYNWKWVFFAQMLNFNIKGIWDWFCSEICTRALQEACLLKWVNSLFTNPAELAELLEKEWYNIL